MRGLAEKTKTLIAAARTILEAEHPMTVRQLFYRLVSARVIDNSRGDYQRVSKAMTLARTQGSVDYDMIVDRSRTSYRSTDWKNLGQLTETMERALQNYRRDAWQDQPYHVEVWCEKDAVTGSIEEIRREYGVDVIAIRGFNSTSNVHEAGTRLWEYTHNGKKPVILYLGDWDPSGKDIERDLVSRLRADTGMEIEVQRIAIFQADIRQFNLPPLRVKDTDSRAEGFKELYGNEAVELDALPPTELRRRLREAIELLIDPAAWQRSKAVEAVQRETCNRYAGVLRRMVDDCGQQSG